jgi:PKD repeat protein
MKRPSIIRATLLALPVALALPCAGAFATAPADFTFGGGPVMSSYNTVEVAWNHEATTASAEYLEGVGAFLGDVAAASGTPSSQNVFSMLPEYSTAGLSGGSQIAAYDSTYLGEREIAATAATIEPPQIQAAIDAAVEGGTLPAPTLDTGGAPQTLYVLMLPPNVVVCIEASSCSGPTVASPEFCSFHYAASYKGVKYTYAVIPDLSGHLAGGCGESPSQLANETSNITHQISESVTDPLVSEEDLAWYDNMNGEIADICDGTSDEAQDTINGHTWTVQKVWSQLADACVAGTEAFKGPTTDFTATPTVNTVALAASGLSTNKLAHVPAGIAGYSWDFGDGQTGSGANVTHAYAAAGEYTVTLTATDNLGFTAHSSHRVDVSAPPSSGNPGGGGATTTSTATSSGSSTGTGAGGNAPAGGASAKATIAATGHASTSTAGATTLVGSGQTVQCPSTGGLCVVTVKAQIATGHISAHHKGRGYSATVATATLTLSPGSSAKVSFKLNATGARLLRVHHHLPLKVTITVRHGSDAPLVVSHLITISAPKRHAAHKR